MTDPTEASRLIVIYREVAPKGDAFNIQMRTRPWIARKVRKHATVAFEVDQRVRVLGTVFTKENNEKLERTITKLKEMGASAIAESLNR